MYRLTQIDVFRIFARLVEDYPTPPAGDLVRPQTFAVIDGREDVFDAAMNKVKIYETIEANRGIFYSRAWEASSYDPNRVTIDYPVVFLLRERNDVGDHDRAQFRYLFGVLDLDDRDSKVDQRVREIKYHDLEVIARSILQEAMRYVFAKADDEAAYTWQPRAILDATAGSYHARAYFDTALKNQNRLAFDIFAETKKAKDVIGVVTELQIEGAFNDALIQYTYE